MLYTVYNVIVLYISWTLEKKELIKDTKSRKIKKYTALSTKIYCSNTEKQNKRYKLSEQYQTCTLSNEQFHSRQILVRDT